MERLIACLRFAVVLAAVAAGLVVATRWWTPVRVAGASMYPAMHPGDLVIVERHAVARVGSVVLADVPGHGAVLHRVVGYGPARSLRTRGDANPIADREPVARSHVRGVVRAVLPVGAVIERWRAL